MFEVHLRTNSSCNLKCLHCYSRSTTHEDGIYLNKDEIVRLLSLFCGKIGAEIHLEGGEIFLYPEAIRALSLLKREYLSLITLTTNGTIFTNDREILDILRGLGAFRISIEGYTDEQNIKVRGIALSKILENASRYLSEGINVCLRLTLNRCNYKNMVCDTLPSLIAIGFNRLQVYEFQSVGRGYDNRHMFELGDSLRDFFAALSEHGKYDKADVRIMFPARRIPEAEFYRNRLEESGIGVKILPQANGISINPDGNVFKCAWDNNKEHSLFNICMESSDRIEDIINGGNFAHDCKYCSALKLTA